MTKMIDYTQTEPPAADTRCPDWCEGQNCDLNGHWADVGFLHATAEAPQAMDGEPDIDPSHVQAGVAVRYSTRDGDPCPGVMVNLDGPNVGLAASLRPAEARQLAEWLVAAADVLDDHDAGEGSRSDVGVHMGVSAALETVVGMSGAGR